MDEHGRCALKSEAEEMYAWKHSSKCAGIVLESTKEPVTWQSFTLLFLSEAFFTLFPFFPVQQNLSTSAFETQQLTQLLGNLW